MTGYRALASNRDFTILWTGQTVSDLGSNVSMFVFPLVAYALSGSALWAAVVEAAFLLGMCGALLPAGVLADRVDRRLLMRTASGAGVVLYASLAVGRRAGRADDPPPRGGRPADRDRGRHRRPGRDLRDPLGRQPRRAVDGAQPEPGPSAHRRAGRWPARRHPATPSPAGCRSPSTPSPTPSTGSCWAACGPTSRPRTARVRRASRTTTWPRASASSCAGRTSARPPSWGALANLLVNAMFFVAILRMVQDGVSPAVIGLVSTAAGVGGILGAIAAPWIIERMPTGTLVVTAAWIFVPLAVPMVLWNQPGRGRRRDLRRAAPQPGRQRRQRHRTGSRTPPPTSRAGRRPPRSSCRCR